MLSDKKIAAVLLALSVIAMVTLSIFIFVDNMSDKSSQPESFNEQSSLPFSLDESQEQSLKIHDTADIQYDKNLYFENIKSFESVILPYNLDLDPQYLPETLFVGDSNTAGLFSFGYMPLQNVLAKPSMAIQAVRTKEFVWFSGYAAPMTIVNAISLLKPRRIIVNFGTNNTVGTSLKDFTAIFKNTLGDINTAYPYCDIIVAAVLPVGKYRENTRIKMQTIDSFNIALAQLCVDEGYKFLNTTETFKDANTGFMKANYVAKDGVHLNSVGYNALLEYITDHKLLTQDRRPPRGFIPKRTVEKTQSSSPPEFDAEPGEEVIFPPTLDSSFSDSTHSVTSEIQSKPQSSTFSSETSTDGNHQASTDENDEVGDYQDGDTSQIIDPFL